MPLEATNSTTSRDPRPVLESVFASQTQQTTVQAVKAQKTTIENTTVPTTVQTTQAPTKAPEPETQRHSEYVVKEGDTLIKISKSVYGKTHQK